jgi:hypothetical protein
MITVLLALGLFIVLMQLGLMSLVRRLAQQLELERSRIDKLERVRLGRRPEAADAGDFASTLGGEPTRPAPAPARGPVSSGRGEPGSAAAAAPALVPSKPDAPAVPDAPGTAADRAAAPLGASSQAPAAPAPERVDPAELRGEMLGLMRQLVDQGLSVREIAARCGLSEAEAELMLSLHGAGHA